MISTLKGDFASFIILWDADANDWYSVLKYGVVYKFLASLYVCCREVGI